MNTRKKRQSETGTLIGVRLQAAELSPLDKFIKVQEAPISRPEAVRRLIAEALQSLGMT
jgi:hypothetical protein